jgi:enoyl-CoA hydratase/carnithine racemase
MTAAVGCVRIEREGKRGLIVLDQPSRLNAMTLAMWRQLEGAMAELANDDRITTIVVRGMGSAFSAGADITEFASLRSTPSDIDRYEANVAAAQRALLETRKPTIALLHGACSGGGAVIALCCRIRFADDSLRFSIPAARIGLVYDRVAVGRLVAAVGPALAYDMLISARTLTSDEALRTGLVNAVIPAADLDRHVEEYTDRVAMLAPISQRGAWAAVRAAEEPTEEKWRLELAELERAAFASADYQEAVAAFLDKRPPRFAGK